MDNNLESAPLEGSLSVGQILKKNRREKNFSLDMIQEETKIPMDVLKAIEEGYEIKTISPFYFRGFIKLYAKFLGVDVSSFFPGDIPKVIPKMEHRVEDEFNLSSWMSNAQNRRLVNQIVVGLVVLVLVWGVWKGISSVFHWVSSIKRTEKVVKPPMFKKEVVVKRTEVVEAKAPVAPVVVAAKESKSLTSTKSSPTKPGVKKGESIKSEVVVPQKVRLSMRPKKKSWLEVKVDGETVFQGNLVEGKTKSWEANEKIEVIGNLSWLELQVNQNFIGLLGMENRKAKRLTITRKGLSVNK